MLRFVGGKIQLAGFSFHDLWSASALTTFLKLRINIYKEHFLNRVELLPITSNIAIYEMKVSKDRQLVNFNSQSSPATQPYHPR